LPLQGPGLTIPSQKELVSWPARLVGRRHERSLHLPSPLVDRTGASGGFTVSPTDDTTLRHLVTGSGSEPRCCYAVENNRKSGADPVKNCCRISLVSSVRQLFKYLLLCLPRTRLLDIPLRILPCFPGRVTMMPSSALLSLAFLAGSALAQQSVWGQCGGIGWTGPTNCASGSCCTTQNPWYAQCTPGAGCGGGGSGPTSTSTSTRTTAAQITTTTTRTSTVATPTSPVPVGSLQQVSNFGNNPTSIQMFIYVPVKLASNPAIIVAVSSVATRWAKQDQLLTPNSPASPLRRLGPAVFRRQQALVLCE